MIRFTTPSITIDTDRNLIGFPKVVLTLEDKTGTEVDVEGPGPNLSVSATSITARLTQEQTGLLERGKIKMQIRAVDSFGNAIASEIMTTTMSDVLKEGVIHGN